MEGGTGPGVSGKRARNYSGRRNEKLWEYFVRTGPETVKCTLCSNGELRTKTSTTTPLHTHMKAKHPMEYKCVVKATNERREQIATDDGSLNGLEETPGGSKQQSMTQFLKQGPQAVKYPKNSAKQLRLDMEIMLFLASTQQPFTLTDEPGFKRLVTYLDPKGSVKSSRTFSRTKCPQLHARMKEEVDGVLRRELVNAAGVAFTCDGWTSRNNDPYQCLTLHYINQAFEMKTFLVGYKNFEGCHTGIATASMIDDVVTNIPGLASETFKICVTDSGANMLSGVRLSKTMKFGLRCLDHIIHNAVNRALDVPDFARVVRQCKDLSNKAHRSSAIQQKIEKACANLSTPIQCKKIITPVPTRWNSMCDCLQSILALKDALLKIAADEHGSELAVLVPSEEEFEALQQLARPLSEIKMVTEKLSAEKQPTLHKVLVCLFDIDKLKVSCRGISDAIDAFIDTYFEYFDKHLPNCGRNEMMYLVGNFFHPFFKGALIKVGDSGGRLWTDTINFILSNHDTAVCRSGGRDETDDNENRPPAKNDRWDELTAIAERHVGQLQQNDQVDKTPLELEIERYFQLPRSPDVEGADVLSWWREKEVTLPRLARLARAYLAIPSTSSPSERVFSCSGNVVTAQRHRLDPDMTEKLVYLSANSRRVEMKNWRMQNEGDVDSDEAEL